MENIIGKVDGVKVGFKIKIRKLKSDIKRKSTLGLTKTALYFIQKKGRFFFFFFSEILLYLCCIK